MPVLCASFIVAWGILDSYVFPLKKKVQSPPTPASKEFMRLHNEKKIKNVVEEQ